MSPAGGVPANAKAADAADIGVVDIALTFDQATVELDALQRSAYAVAAEMTVDIRVYGAEYVCTLFPRTRDATGDELKHRFRAEVNDQTLRVRIAKETEPVRNLIFALAFSQTGLVAADTEAVAES